MGEVVNLHGPRVSVQERLVIREAACKLLDAAAKLMGCDIGENDWAAVLQCAANRMASETGDRAGTADLLSHLSKSVIWPGPTE